MARLVVVSACLALVLATSCVECSNGALSSSLEIAVVQNLTEYLKANPNVKLLQRLIKEPLAAAPSPRLQITYKIGNRINGKKLKNSRAI